jgi:hypothetical protein
MKTIKFLHYVKYPVLVLIAIFGIFIGGTQNPPPKPMAYSAAGEIGGQATPRSGGTPVGHFNDKFFACYRFPAEIGGNGSAQPKPSGPPFGIYEIGGQRVPGTTIPLVLTEIGGQRIPNDPNPQGFAIGGGTNQNKPQEPNPLGAFVPATIGGGRMPLHERTDIDGNSAPRSYAFHCMEIGGNNQPGSETRNAAGSFPVNIGGQNIGGNQGVPHMPLPFYVYDFADDFTLASLIDIGGEPAPRHLNDIGGSQLPPKTVSDIGGNSAPKSYVFQSNDIGGGQTPPRQ